MPGIRGRHADGLLRGSEHCHALTPEKTRKRKEKNTAVLLQNLLGDFNKEQEAFIKDKLSKGSEAAVPPWVGCPNEENLKEECLSLSTVSRPFSSAIIKEEKTLHNHALLQIIDKESFHLCHVKIIHCYFDPCSVLIQS